MINIGKNNVTLMVGSEEIIEAYIGSVKIYPNFIEEIPFIPEWETGNTMAISRESAEAESVDGCIYIMGGFDENKLVGETVEKYDPVENRFYFMAPMPNGSINFASVAVGHLIYVSGGMARPDGGGPPNKSSVFSVYNTKTNTWAKLASSPWRISSHTLGANASGTKLYILGGALSSQTNDKVLIYDIASNGWSIGAARMPTPVSGPVGFSNNNIIYAAGGVEWKTDVTLSKIQYYSIDEDKWGEIPMPYSYIAGAATLLLDGKVYFTGGQTAENDNPMRNVNILNLADHTWGGGIPLKSPRMRHCSVECQGLLYVLGGRHSYSGDPSNTMDVFGGKGDEGV